MNKILKTILITLIAVFGAGFLFVPSVNAQVDGLVVEFETTPLFQEENFLPGEGVTRWVKVTNNSGQPQRIATEAINYPKPVSEYDLSRVLMLVIKENATDLYGGSSPTDPKSLYDFYQDSETYSEIYLSELENKKTTQYNFTISFLSETEKKEWQDATTNFDILIGFQGVEGQAPPGGGGVGLPPGLTIKSEKGFNITATTASFYWETSYDATSQVIYDTEPGKFDLNAGPPKYGYTFSKEWDDIYGLGKGAKHNVTLTGLTSGTTYYYRMVSHASLAISQERSFTTLGVKGEDIVYPPVYQPPLIPLVPTTPVTPGVPVDEPREEDIEEEDLLEAPELSEVAEEEEPIFDFGKLLAGIGGLFSSKNLPWLLVLLLLIIIILLILKRRKNKE